MTSKKTESQPANRGQPAEQEWEGHCWRNDLRRVADLFVFAESVVFCKVLSLSLSRA